MRSLKGNLNKYSCAVLVILALFATVFSTQGFCQWEKSGTGIEEPKITAICAGYLSSTMTFVGTSKGIYRSRNKGKDYELIFQPHGSKKKVNFLYIDQKNDARDNVIYAATDSGLYRSKDEGVRWEQIFYSAESGTKICTAVTVGNNTIFLGTKNGLFFKNVNDTTWQKEHGGLGQGKAISLLDVDGQYIYAATDSELFSLSLDNNSFKKLFQIGFGSSEEISNSNEEGFENKMGGIRDMYISVHPENSLKKIYLVTQQGIYFSLNQGKSWERLSSAGLPVKEATSLIVAGQNEEYLLAATTQGIFAYSQGKWTSVYEGLESNNISVLAKDRIGNLYAATDRGLFYLDVKKALFTLKDASRSHHDAGPPALSYRDIESHFLNDPRIDTVQNIAIEYAEVHPDKIQKWRSAARKKALFPSVSFDLDRAGNDLYHWDTGASPDVLQKGREYVDWGISFSWDFSDLVWSTDQTTIDSRSKLMVELREDILDQVTRLYFERRRVQIELLTLNLEPQALIDKQMRIAELTAQIDGLTGGKFSQMIEKTENEKFKMQNQN